MLTKSYEESLEREREDSLPSVDRGPRDHYHETINVIGSPLKIRDGFASQDKDRFIQIMRQTGDSVIKK